jgi:uncharacterized protein YgiM (DUF1202 family)
MRNRWMGLLLAAMLVMSLAPAAMAETQATVNNPSPADRLNLRTAPRADATTLGKYYNGTPVAVLGDAQDGWVRARIGNLQGYMMDEFLAYGQDRSRVASAIPACTIQNASGTGLHLRKRQSTDASSLGLYKNGETVQVLGVEATWCHVQTSDGQIGFMLREKLSPVPDFDKGTAGTPAVADWPFPASDYAGVVVNPDPAERLHLRAAPSESAASLGKYYTGVRLFVLGVGEWTEVHIGNQLGYMKTEFISMGDDPVTSAMPLLTVHNPGAAANLHLRAEPSTAASSLGLYKNGTQVIVMGINGDWAHVIVDGTMGFMLAAYLR